MFRQILAVLVGLLIGGMLLRRPLEAGTKLTAQELLQRWADALGGRDRLAAIDHMYTKSRVSTSGLEGTVEEWTTARGESRQDLDFAGMFGNVTVFDGKQGWIRDQNGKVKELQGKELEAQVTAAYFSSLSHLVPGRREASFNVRGLDESGKAYVVDITPEGGKTVTVYLDVESILPLRQERPADDRTETVFLSDWRDESGLLVPHVLRITTGDPRYELLITVNEVVLDGPQPDGLYARPAEGPRDYRFQSGTEAPNIPFDLSSNHIYVEAKIGSKGPLWFIFDTGAGVTVIDRARAESLGLKMQGQIEGRGAGEGSVDVSVIPGASFSLPGVELLDQTVMAIPLSQIEPYEGRAIDGILGYDLISRFVVVIDYAARRMHLYEPSSYDYQGTGERVPIVLEDNHPHVQAEVSVGKGTPVKGNFTIDTGARSALHLSKPFCDLHRFADLTRTIVGGFGAGVGGETKQKIGRATTLRMGGVVLNDVITGFSEDEKGAMASTESQGNIGGDILRRFTVILDYSRHEMILEPNESFVSPFEYDMCGAFLRVAASDPETFEIHRLIDDSPARKAGLEEGDLIAGVDGRPASELTLEEVRQMFLREDREYRLDIRRGSESRQVTVKTKRLI
jgi:hypothetical protein